MVGLCHSKQSISVLATNVCHGVLLSVAITGTLEWVKFEWLTECTIHLHILESVLTQCHILNSDIVVTLWIVC
jgi:hypothetical protein